MSFNVVVYSLSFTCFKIIKNASINEKVSWKLTKDFILGMMFGTMESPKGL